jgi:hypothetical protein
MAGGALTLNDACSTCDIDDFGFVTFADIIPSRSSTAG